MSQIGSWVFLGFAVVHLLIPWCFIYHDHYWIGDRVDGSRNVMLGGILCAVIAGVLRLP